MLFSLGRAKCFVIAALLLVPALLALALMPHPARAVSGINEQLNYQARLLDSTGAVVPDGTYNMEFKIYQDGDGVLGGGDETLKWTETRTSTDKVTVTNGYFSVQLGSVTAFGTSVDWNQDTLWLSLNIGGTGTPSWDGEMSPFRRLAATAYALNAKQLGGLDWSKFVQIAPSAVQTDTSTLSTLFLNKTGASGNILQLQKNGSDVLTIGNTGAVTMQNTSNSTTAVKVLNANGDSGIIVDTTTSNLITNHSLESATTGWSAMGSATVSQLTTDSRDGTKSLKVAATAANDGTKYTYSLASSTTYSFSVWGKRAPTGTFSTIEMGRSEDGSTNTSCATSHTFSSDNWARRTCTFTTGTVSGTTYIYVRQSDATTRDWYIDAVQLETGSTVTPYHNTRTDISGRLMINAGQSTVSSTAFIQGAGGGGDVLEIRGSGENDLFQSLLTVKKADGTSLFNVGDTGNGSTFTGGSSFFDSAAVSIIAQSAAVRALDLKAAASQTADIFRIKDSSNNTLLYVDADGDFSTTKTITNGGFDFKLGNTDQTTRGDSGLSRALVKNTGSVLVINYASDFTGGVQVQSPMDLRYTTDSATAFTVTGSGPTTRFVVDTTNNRVYIGSTTADTTGALLVLDTKNSANDPTGVNGGMYYNSSENKFKCYENSAWRVCLPPASRGKYKTAVENVNNSTTFQNDDHLAITYEANKTYQLTGTIYATSITTADLKFQWTYSGTATGVWSIVGSINTDVFVGRSALWTAAIAPPTDSVTYCAFEVRGSFSSTTAGTLQLQWAQNTAQASNSTLRDGSWIELKEITN